MPAVGLRDGVRGAAGRAGTALLPELARALSPASCSRQAWRVLMLEVLGDLAVGRALDVAQPEVAVLAPARRAVRRGAAGRRVLDGAQQQVGGLVGRPDQPGARRSERQRVGAETLRLVEMGQRLRRTSGEKASAIDRSCHAGILAPAARGR